MNPSRFGLVEFRAQRQNLFPVMKWILLSALLVAPVWAQQTVSLAGLSAQLPKEWKAVPVEAGSMRSGQWQVPAIPGTKEGGDLTAFYFGAGMGGDVASNTERWKKQFSKPDGTPAESEVHTATVNGLTITKVITYGTFASGMPGQKLTPKSQYGLAGAIIEAPQGNIFFKLTGPESLIKANLENFEHFLSTLKTVK